MISRREFVQAILGLTLLPRELLAKQVDNKLIDWHTFQSEINRIATATMHGHLDQRKMSQQSLFYLQQLDVKSTTFIDAVENSFETGNQFWLWQRLIKQSNLNGGILHIDKENLVPLHDHPGATGMLKIIHGEVEIWNFDVREKEVSSLVELKRTSRRILRAGDVAVLHPDQGNIHALRSITQECSMLDFFIPPYKGSERSWYEPLDKSWFDMVHFVCKKIPQHEYTMI